MHMVWYVREWGTHYAYLAYYASSSAARAGVPGVGRAALGRGQRLRLRVDERDDPTGMHA